jgi:hypothetical protein
MTAKVMMTVSKVVSQKVDLWAGLAPSNGKTSQDENKETRPQNVFSGTNRKFPREEISLNN